MNGSRQAKKSNTRSTSNHDGPGRPAKKTTSGSADKTRSSSTTTRNRNQTGAQQQDHIVISVFGSSPVSVVSPNAHRTRKAPSSSSSSTRSSTASQQDGRRTNGGNSTSSTSSSDGRKNNGRTSSSKTSSSQTDGRKNNGGHSTTTSSRSSTDGRKNNGRNSSVDGRRYLSTYVDIHGNEQRENKKKDLDEAKKHSTETMASHQVHRAVASGKLHDDPHTTTGSCSPLYGDCVGDDAQVRGEFKHLTGRNKDNNQQHVKSATTNSLNNNNDQHVKSSTTNNLNNNNDQHVNSTTTNSLNNNPKNNLNKNNNNATNPLGSKRSMATNNHSNTMNGPVADMVNQNKNINEKLHTLKAHDDVHTTTGSCSPLYGDCVGDDAQVRAEYQKAGRNITLSDHDHSSSTVKNQFHQYPQASQTTHTTGNVNTTSGPTTHDNNSKNPYSTSKRTNSSVNGKGFTLDYDSSQVNQPASQRGVKSNEGKAFTTSHNQQQPNQHQEQKQQKQQQQQQYQQSTTSSSQRPSEQQTNFGRNAGANANDKNSPTQTNGMASNEFARANQGVSGIPKPTRASPTSNNATDKKAGFWDNMNPFSSSSSNSKRQYSTAMIHLAQMKSFASRSANDINKDALNLEPKQPKQYQQQQTQGQGRQSSQPEQLSPKEQEGRKQPLKTSDNIEQQQQRSAQKTSSHDATSTTSGMSGAGNAEHWGGVPLSSTTGKNNAKIGNSANNNNFDDARNNNAGKM